MQTIWNSPIIPLLHGSADSVDQSADGVLSSNLLAPFQTSQYPNGVVLRDEYGPLLAVETWTVLHLCIPNRPGPDSLNPHQNPLRHKENGTTSMVAYSPHLMGQASRRPKQPLPIQQWSSGWRWRAGRWVPCRNGSADSCPPRAAHLLLGCGRLSPAAGNVSLSPPNQRVSPSPRGVVRDHPHQVPLEGGVGRPFMNPILRSPLTTGRRRARRQLGWGPMVRCARPPSIPRPASATIMARDRSCRAATTVALTVAVRATVEGLPLMCGPGGGLGFKTLSGLERHRLCAKGEGFPSHVQPGTGTWCTRPHHQGSCWLWCLG